jgi:hypothetical protein
VRAGTIQERPARADECFDAWRHCITVSLRDPIVFGAGRQLWYEDDPRMRVEV